MSLVIGSETPGTEVEAGAGDIEGSQYVADETKTVNKLVFHVEPTAGPRTVFLGVYSDHEGRPQKRLRFGSVTVPEGTTAIAVTLAEPLAVVEGTTYWLLYWCAERIEWKFVPGGLGRGFQNTESEGGMVEEIGAETGNWTFGHGQAHFEALHVAEEGKGDAFTPQCIGPLSSSRRLLQLAATTLAVYWLEAAEGKSWIARYDRVSKTIEAGWRELPSSNAIGLLTDGVRLYTLDSERNVYVMPADGSEEPVLLANLPDFIYFEESVAWAITPTHLIFFSDNSERSFGRIKLDGTGYEPHWVAVPGEEFVRALVSNDTTIWWIQEPGATLEIWKLRVAGGSPELVLANGGEAYGDKGVALALGKERLYWFNAIGHGGSEGILGSVGLNGGGPGERTLEYEVDPLNGWPAIGVVLTPGQAELWINGPEGGGEPWIACARFVEGGEGGGGPTGCGESSAWSFKGPVDDTVLASLPFCEGQAHLRGATQVAALFATCEWHGGGAAGDPARPNFAMVAPGGPLSELVGERVQLTHNGKSVLAYVHRASDTVDTAISVTRRLFLALAPLSLTSIDVTVRVVD